MRKFLLSVLLLASCGSGKTDYCYIEAASPGNDSPVYYRLRQHRPWRADATASTCAKTEDCIDTAKKMGCPFQ